MDHELLKKVAKKIKTGNELMGSRWQNCEAEVIASQCITSCNYMLSKKKEAISFCNTNLFRNSIFFGHNSRGVELLKNDKCIEILQYKGKIKPPKGTVVEDGHPMIIIPTDKLLNYVLTFS